MKPDKKANGWLDFFWTWYLDEDDSVPEGDRRSRRSPESRMDGECSEGTLDEESDMSSETDMTEFTMETIHRVDSRLFRSEREKQEFLAFRRWKQKNEGARLGGSKRFWDDEEASTMAVESSSIASKASASCGDESTLTSPSGKSSRSIMSFPQTTRSPPSNESESARDNSDNKNLPKPGELNQRTQPNFENKKEVLPSKSTTKAPTDIASDPDLQQNAPKELQKTRKKTPWEKAISQRGSSSVLMQEWLKGSGISAGSVAAEAGNTNPGIKQQSTSMKLEEEGRSMDKMQREDLAEHKATGGFIPNMAVVNRIADNCTVATKEAENCSEWGRNGYETKGKEASVKPHQEKGYFQSLRARKRFDTPVFKRAASFDGVLVCDEAAQDTHSRRNTNDAVEKSNEKGFRKVKGEKTTVAINEGESGKSYITLGELARENNTMKGSLSEESSENSMRERQVASSNVSTNLSGEFHENCVNSYSKLGSQKQLKGRKVDLATAIIQKAQARNAHLNTTNRQKSTMASKPFLNDSIQLTQSAERSPIFRSKSASVDVELPYDDMSTQTNAMSVSSVPTPVLRSAYRPPLGKVQNKAITGRHSMATSPPKRINLLGRWKQKTDTSSVASADKVKHGKLMTTRGRRKTSSVC